MDAGPEGGEGIQPRHPARFVAPRLRSICWGADTGLQTLQSPRAA